MKMYVEKLIFVNFADLPCHLTGGRNSSPLSVVEIRKGP